MPRRSLSRLFLASAVAWPLTACGPGLTTMATEAMDLCIAARNPVFSRGQGAVALDTPLPARAQELGRRMNYERAYKVYRAIAEEARDQVTLVCALEMASYYRDREAQRFIARYLQHPDAAIQVAAQRLGQDPATVSLPTSLPATSPVPLPAADSAAPGDSTAAPRAGGQSP